MSDLSSVTLHLKPQHSARIPAWLGRAVQANFLSTLETIHPAISKIVHDAPGPKPFTGSSLTGAKKQGDMIQLQRDDVLQLRYTTLHPQMTAIFHQDILPQWEKGEISLHNQPLEVIDIQTTDAGWNGQVDYVQLVDAASTQSTLTMDFTSPTSFKRTGGYFTPLPQPELVFSSLMDRWTAFAPFRLPESLYDLFQTQVVITDATIRTEKLIFARGNKGVVTGFLGNVTFTLSGDKETKRYIHALADFAKYSGVGVKTTVGMGQARTL